MAVAVQLEIQVVLENTVLPLLRIGLAVAPVAINILLRPVILLILVMVELVPVQTAGALIRCISIIRLDVIMVAITLMPLRLTPDPLK